MLWTLVVNLLKTSLRQSIRNFSIWRSENGKQYNIVKSWALEFGLKSIFDQTRSQFLPSEKWAK